MKQKILNWVDTYLIELILGVCLVLAVGILIIAYQHDQYYTTKCTASGGTLITTSDNEYVCIQNNSTIKL